MKIIEITVSSAGETKVQTKGFVGMTCRQASAFLEKALGTVTEDKITSAVENAQCQNTLRQ